MSFRSSLWFTRGWTLQELLAPRRLSFLNNRWAPVLSQSHDEDDRIALSGEISEVTGIDILNVADFVPLNEPYRYTRAPSTSTIMSWAAKRETSRAEDIAYCLLGLFGINMPLLYGEGDAAFKRLQMEIIAKTTDETIFVWNDPDDEGRHGSSMLAPSPACFADTGDIWEDHTTPFRGHYSITHRGLLMRVLTFSVGYKPLSYGTRSRCYCFALRCRGADNKIALVPISAGLTAREHHAVHPMTEELEILYSRDGDGGILWCTHGELATMARKLKMTLKSKPSKDLSDREFGYRLWVEHSRMIYLQI